MNSAWFAGAIARAAVDKARRELPQAQMVPATVMKSQQQPLFGERTALVHVDGDPPGELRQVDVIDGRSYEPGARVMVEYVPPQGAVIRGALDQSQAVPAGWADCTIQGPANGVVAVPDYQLIGEGPFTLVPMDAWVASPAFLTAFKPSIVGWEAIRRVSVEVDYTASWSPQGVKAGAYQTALMVSAQLTGPCPVDTAAVYACGDNHYWDGNAEASAALGVLWEWFHNGSTMFTVEPGTIIAIGARWFSDISSGAITYLAPPTSCGSNVTARLAVHLLDLVAADELDFGDGGDT